MKKIFNWKLLLLLIILLGFISRVYNLGSIPGFFADEAAFGYNAYSLLHMGKDEYGKVFPLVLKSFGDYKGALYAYLDIPFIVVLGLTPLAVRLPSVILDTLTILLIFLFIKELLNNRNVALIASFLYAISPWSINISRVTGDVTAAVFFSLLMSYSIIRAEKTSSLKYLIVAAISAFAAIVSYAPFRFYVVIIPFLFFAISIKWVKRRFYFSKAALFITIVVFLIGLVYTFKASIARFNEVSILSTPQTQLILNEQIREDQFTRPLITRFFHNKLVNYTRTILENTGQYFTLDYLFLNGGYPKRERIPDTGLFYIWEFLFLLAGIYLIIKRRKREEVFLLLWWIVLLIPSIITYDEIPNVHRNFIVLPAIAAIIAIGVYEVFTYKPFVKFKKIFGLALSVLLLLGIYEFLYFSHQYFMHFDLHQPWYRGYAYKGLVSGLEKYYPDFKKIVVTKTQGSPYIYILFYSKYDPAKYQA